MSAMRELGVIQFVWYFLRLRLSVALGLYYTANPLNIGWRWHHWQQFKKLHKQVPTKN